MQGKTPSERRTSLLKVYPHLTGKIRRASSFIRTQRDVGEVTATSTLDPPTRSSTGVLAQLYPLSDSPWPLLEPLLASEASSPTTQPTTPFIECLPMSNNASQSSFHTADSRVNLEGADLDEGPSPSRFNRDEQYDSDESVEDFPDTLLTPLYLVPNLTSDMEDRERFSQHLDYDNDVVFNESDSGNGRSHDCTPAHGADGDFMTTVPASPPLPPPPLRLELNFPLTSGPSMLEELSSLSPHFSSLSSLPLPPRTPNTDTRYRGTALLLSPRRARLSASRTLWPIADGHFERRSASTSPRTSATATPHPGMQTTATSGSLSALGADGARTDDEPAGSASETGSPSWWRTLWF